MLKRNSRPSPKRKRTTKNEDWDSIFGVLRTLSKEHPTPSLNVLHSGHATPWQILSATIISLRTRDEVTLASSRKLFALAPGAAETRLQSEDAIAQAIFPAGFYKTKARQLKTIASLLESIHDQVPNEKASLLALPGVGPKTANLVLNLAFGIEAICVDTHVHRIPNRLGWISTKTPEESERALELLWPRKLWIAANELLVSFGQSTCTPLAPRCSSCPLIRECAQVGVLKPR